MTFKEKFKSCSTWQERAVVVTFTHRLLLIRKKKWTIRKTAKYLEISIGYVSESMKLAKRLDEVNHFATRKDALTKLK